MIMSKRIQDERVIQETHQQNSAAFVILYYGVLLDLLYHQFILAEPVSRYWDLGVLFFGVTFFLVAKRIGSGLLTEKSKFRPAVISAIAATIVFTVVNYWWLDRTSPSELIIGGITFFVAFGATMFLMQYLSKRKNDAMLEDE